MNLKILKQLIHHDTHFNSHTQTVLSTKSDCFQYLFLLRSFFLEQLLFGALQTAENSITATHCFAVISQYILGFLIFKITYG